MSETSADLAQRKAHVTGKLQKRDDVRHAEVQKRKEERELTTAEHESSDVFIESFSKAKTELQQKIENSSEVSKVDLNWHFDSIALDLQKMQKFLTDSTVFLPPYEIQKSQEQIAALQTSVQIKRDELIPKKKFAFKSKRKTDNIDGQNKPKGSVIAKEINIDIAECNFADKSGEELQKGSDEINNKDVALTRLNDCAVKLQGSPSAVHINKLINCKIFCGPVSGSIFIDDCVNCTFMLACQQLRIHSTTDTCFYIHVTSKAIIEDCNRVDFAPYNWYYEGLNEHYIISGLDRERNNWNDVDDFNWLASDTPSPHWKVLNEKDRKTFKDV